MNQHPQAEPEAAGYRIHGLRLSPGPGRVSLQRCGSLPNLTNDGGEDACMRHGPGYAVNSLVEDMVYCSHLRLVAPNYSYEA